MFLGEFPIFPVLDIERALVALAEGGVGCRIGHIRKPSDDRYAGGASRTIPSSMLGSLATGAALRAGRLNSSCSPARRPNIRIALRASGAPEMLIKGGIDFV
jgi:hypothetical protein